MRVSITGIVGMALQSVGILFQRWPKFSIKLREFRTISLGAKRSKTSQISVPFRAYLATNVNSRWTTNMRFGFSRFIVTQTALVVFAMSLPTQAAWAQASATMEKTTGMWVEGPGFDIKYGGNYDECAQRCLATATCVMVEYYRPEKKCNMYNTIRPLKTGGSSIVGTKKSPKP
jgi:PAN-like domain